MVMNEALRARAGSGAVVGDECEWSGVLVSSDKLLAVNVNTTDNRSKKLCYGTEGTGYRRHKRLLYSYWETGTTILAGLRHTDCDPGTHDARDQNMDTRKCSCRLRHTLVPSTGVHVPSA